MRLVAQQQRKHLCKCNKAMVIFLKQCDGNVFFQGAPSCSMVLHWFSAPHRQAKDGPYSKNLRKKAEEGFGSNLFYSFCLQKENKCKQVCTFELAFKNLRCNMLWCHLGRYFYSPRFCLVWFGWLHQVIDCLRRLCKKT